MYVNIDSEPPYPLISDYLKITPGLYNTANLCLRGGKRAGEGHLVKRHVIYMRFEA